MEIWNAKLFFLLSGLERDDEDERWGWLMQWCRVVRSWYVLFSAPFHGVILWCLFGLLRRWGEDYWSSTAVGLSSCSDSGSRGLTTSQSPLDPGQWGPGQMLWCGQPDSHLEGWDGGGGELTRAKSVKRKETGCLEVGFTVRSQFN